MKKIKIIILILTLIIFINTGNVFCIEETEEILQQNQVEQENEVEEQQEETEQEEVPIEIKGTQSIEDGTYNIISKIDVNKFFDITNASMQDGTILQIYQSSKSIQQKFILEYVGDGFYKIKSKKSNKVLTVENEKPSIGSTISQQEDKNLDTQKWILKKYSTSVYEIISKCGNLYINLENTSNGQALKLAKENQSDKQRFIFVNVMPKKDIVHINDGIYQIQLNSGKVLDVAAGKRENNANIQVWGNTKVQQQKFRISRIGSSDYYKITAIHSAKSLDVSGANETPKTNVQQYSLNGSNAQSWLFKNAGNGYYNIISKSNGLCLDISGEEISKNGANVQMNYINDTFSQKFKLKPINIIENNTYEIETKLNSNKVIDIEGASKKDWAKAKIWSAGNKKNQRFKFVAISADTYKIISKKSNKALTANTSNKLIYQYKYTGTKNQQWQIIEKGNGYYNLVCKANGLCLGIYKGNAKNGQKTKLYSKSKGAAVEFRFITGFRKFYSEGTYGKSGLKKKGDKRGTKLKYYKIGKGSKSFFATFSIHGFEDSYSHDGEELTYIAEEFKKYLKNNITEDIVNKYTIYIFPCLNPDGQYYGYSNNGPGRTTLYSNAPKHKGIDMNRNWSVGFIKQTSDRNYNGTKPFQAYEAKYLRNFILNHEGKANILVDTHGWLNETMGDKALGKYYRKKLGLPKHIDAYGRGYLINWARTLKKGRSTLVELPEVTSHKQVVNRNYAQKWINATMKMLKEN